MKIKSVKREKCNRLSLSGRDKKKRFWSYKTFCSSEASKEGSQRFTKSESNKKCNPFITLCDK